MPARTGRTQRGQVNLVPNGTICNANSFKGVEILKTLAVPRYQVWLDKRLSNTLSIDLLDDELTEGEERFTVVLTGMTAAGTIGSPSAITIIVRDDEDFLLADGFED